MSARLVIQVIGTARAEEGQRDRALGSHVNLLILLLLADGANKGGATWPSIAALSRISRLSPRSVRYAISALENDGHISTEKRPGRNDRYTVHPGRTCRATPATGATAEQPRQEMPLPRQDVPDTAATGADESYQEPETKIGGVRSGSLNGQRPPEAMITPEQMKKLREDPVAYWAEHEASNGGADA
jgi:hypothetical protein